ncbi:MAG TPA: TonB-dependent siderophore receptor [Candidatus Binatia bacterium]|nr:TonB-dependent siderophore receptor [Candidatus Binatia bacterium]
MGLSLGRLGRGLALLGLIAAAPAGVFAPPAGAEEERPERRPIPLPELVVPGLAEQEYVVPQESRTGRPILDVPGSITVVPRPVIEEQKALRLEDVLRNVAGVVRNAGRGFNDDFVIRGFRPTEGSLILRDQFPQAIDDLSPFAEIWNVDRVEVLKGPNAFLYGRSEPGGLINLVTKRPLSESRYHAEFAVGSFDLYRPAFDITGPLWPGGSLFYRLNGLYEKGRSFRDFVDSERAFVAPALTWKIGPDTAVTFLFEYLHDERTRDTGIVAVGNRPARIPVGTFLNDVSDRVVADSYRAGYELTHGLAEDWRLRQAFRFLRLEGSFIGTSVGEPDAAGNARRSRGGFDNIRNQGFGMQTEVIGSFRTGPFVHRPLVGLELTRNLFEGQFMVSTGPVPGINIFDPDHHQPMPGVRPVVGWEIRHDQAGLYLQDEIQITRAWRVIGGGRLDFIGERDEDPVTGRVRREQVFTNFAPRAGIVYQPTLGLSLYGNYSESFQPVGGTNPDGRTFEPVKGRGVEVGAKLDPFRGRLVGTLALFQITKENVPNPDPERPNFRVQTGEERSRGVEIEVVGRLWADWDVIASWAWTEARITADTNPTRRGRDKAGVPEQAASVWTRYRWSHGPLQGLSLGLGLFYVGERPGDLLDSYRLPGYVRLDALVGYEAGPLRAALNIQNVTDTTHYVSGGSRSSVFPGPPLSVLATVAVRY